MQKLSIQTELGSSKKERWKIVYKFKGSGTIVSILIAVALSINCATYGQTISGWQTLRNAPVVPRHNDVFFVTPKLGWIVNGSGQIYKTIDGGNSWQLQFEQNVTHFRCVGFLDSLRGWAGNVGFGEFGTTDTTVMYRTIDGGTNWSPFNSFTGPKPKGLCGMYVLNDSAIFAVGRVRGPSFFAKTTGSGNTWISKDMSAYAAGLIDVYFFHPDSGYAVGLTNVEHSNSSGVVLFTSDGGETWEERFKTGRTGEWCWKISFPSRKVGYVSLQRNSKRPIYFLKTSDGGETWESKVFSNSYYFVQGIGFVTEELGWIGGNSSLPAFQTNDGGETWQRADFSARLNRLRFLGDSLGYAVGRSVYKYTPLPPVSVATEENETPHSFDFEQNYPNPFNPSTIINYQLPVQSEVELTIYDLLGEKIRILVKENQWPGFYVVQWDGKNRNGAQSPSGIYFYQVKSEKFTQTKRMLLLR
ncbi:MAG: T9SS type A sorting domain-containing protein [Caldithrix sp.]|nr:MAG: T9SS type A sorting domain-containing protein [Caldithrix sp.]